MIAIVDYGVGNLKSLQNAFRYLGLGSKMAATPEEIRQADRLVLPGVGAFGYGMMKIEQQGLREPLLEAAAAGKPVLGICLGMQLLFAGSEEADRPGLDLIPGEVVRFRTALKVPHMGWNEIVPARESPLLAGLPDTRYAYFVHSYYCVPGSDSVSAATTVYDQSFCSVVVQDNIFGVQFHPEKSQELGLRILKNFAEV